MKIDYQIMDVIEAIYFQLIVEVYGLINVWILSDSLYNLINSYIKIIYY
jgi:hypothetical protein